MGGKGDIELNFPIENGDVFIHEVFVFLVVLTEAQKQVRIQLGDPVKNDRFDVVHPRGGGKLGEVAFHSALFEFGECSLYFDAIVDLLFALAQLDLAGQHDVEVLELGQVHGAQLVMVADDLGVGRKEHPQSGPPHGPQIPFELGTTSPR